MAGRRIAAGLAVGLLTMAAATGAWANPPAALQGEAAVARLSALDVKYWSKPLNVEALGKLTSIHIGERPGRKLTDGDCATMAALPKLTGVTFVGARISKACLAAFAKVGALTSLSFNKVRLEPGALSLVSELRSLSSLTLSAVRGLDAKELTALSGLTNLTYMSLSQGTLSEGGDVVGDDIVLAVAKHPDIKRLYINYAQFTDASMAALAEMDSLEQLSLYATSVTDKGLALLAKGGRRLRTLSLQYSAHLSPAGVAPLADLPELADLTLSTSRVGGGLASLAKAKRLTSLRISYTRATDADFAGIAKIRRLSSLDASGNYDLTDAGLAALAGAGNLQRLDVSGAWVSDAGVAHLKGLRRLKQLTLTDTRVTDQAVDSLAAMSLSSVYLNGTGLTDAGLTKLAGIKTITTIGAYYCGVSKKVVVDLKAARKGLNIYN